MQQTVLGSSTSQEISCIHYSIHVTPILTAVLSTIWLSVDAIDLGRLVGYCNPSHVTHQRLQYCCTCFGRFLRPSSGALRNCRSSLWWV